MLEHAFSVAISGKKSSPLDIAIESEDMGMSACFRANVICSEGLRD